MYVADYSTIKTNTKKQNAVNIQSINIAGEAIHGIYAVVTSLTFLYKHIVNDTYHPYIFHYYTGSSVGTIAIDIILKSRFLREVYGKKKSLEFIDAMFEFLKFNNIKDFYFDSKDCLTPTYLIQSMMNLFTIGAFCKKDSVLQFVNEGIHKDLKFDKSINYFVTTEYYNWLSIALKNVFHICYNSSDSTMIVMTGSNVKFKNTKFVIFENLNCDNYIDSILSSTSIPVVYQAGHINNIKYTTDGSIASTNDVFIMHMLINNINHFKNYETYKPLLNFFDILPENNDNFVIVHNCISIQYVYEDIEKYSYTNIPIIESIERLLNVIPRELNSSMNSLQQISATFFQPFVPEYSSGKDMCKIISKTYNKKKKK